MTNKTILLSVILSISIVQSLTAQPKNAPPAKEDACPVDRIEPERLPDLNIPRSGHNVFCINDEVIVTGGHTSGFIPTPTAEYLKNGEWHLVNMVYTHDAGFGVAMKSGKVLLAGGFEKNIGIGQTYEVETYEPQNHSFESVGIMSTKRTMFSALELDSGKVLISGNWYHPDQIEIYDGTVNFTKVKESSQSRAFPYIFRIAPDDAIVFGALDNYGKYLDTIIVDCLKGESFTVPLFDEWKPLYPHTPIRCDESFIGNLAKGIYSYLLPVINKEGQMAIAKTEGTEFSLLPTACPIPMRNGEDTISYYSQILIDQKSQRGYLIGSGSLPNAAYRKYILCIEYGHTPCPITLFYTDSIPEMATTTPILTPEGNLLMTGGIANHNISNNFHPTGAVLLFHFREDKALADTADTSQGSYGWMVGLLLLATVVVGVCIYLKKKAKPIIAPTSDIEIPVADTDDPLMQRILHLIVEKKMYLNNDLTTSDIAQELGVHRNQVSACINAQNEKGFSQLINGYRIEYAKQLIRQHPEMKLYNVGYESGFTNETSFYRTFKALTGKTPSEWKATID